MSLQSNYPDFQHQSIRLRFLLDRNDGGFWGEDPDDKENNYIILRSTEQSVTGAWKIDDPAKRKMTPEEFSKIRLITGDLLITKSSGSADHIGKTSIVTSDIEKLNCGFSNFMQRLRVAKTVDPRFIAYLLNSDIGRTQFRILSTTTTGLGNLTSEVLSEILAPNPIFSQQKAIADYLDRETSRIDALIAAKERLLELLAEKRRAVITHAVTHGLNPDVVMRDSGVEWLGQIPSHWEIRRIAFLFRERDERNMPDLPLLAVSIHTGVSIRIFSEDHVEQMAQDFSTYKVAYKGDIAFNKMRMWQGAVGVSPTDGLVSPDYVVAHPIADVEPAYYGFLFKIAAFSAETARNSHGIVWDRLRLYWDEFRDIEVPVPSCDEQSEITMYINRETTKLDHLSNATQKTIDLLHERRAALIAAAISGQIEPHL